jgi:uncharacterized RDD family membrane protein YckC
MDKISRASWRDRFGAWLIDVLIVGIGWISVANAWDIDVFRPVGLAMLLILLFVYWTFLEGYRGQSIGKMVLNIVIVGPDGEMIGFRDSALESLGKAFLLPIDCLIGWAAYREQGLRAFNKLSRTIVVSASDKDWCTSL